MPVRAKICGLSTPEAVRAAVGGGAAYVGFVFFPRSPRDIAPERAAALAAPARAAGIGVAASWTRSSARSAPTSSSSTAARRPSAPRR